MVVLCGGAIVMSMWAIALLLVTLLGKYFKDGGLSDDENPEELDRYDEIIKYVKDNYGVIVEKCWTVVAAYIAVFILTASSFLIARQVMTRDRNEDIDDYEYESYKPPLKIITFK